MAHTIKYLEDTSADETEIARDIALTFDAALTLAGLRIPELRKTHGGTVGFVIEDDQGRIVWIGVPSHFNRRSDPT